MVILLHKTLETLDIPSRIEDVTAERITRRTKRKENGEKKT